MDVLLSGPFAPRGLSSNPFPIFLTNSIPNLWNIHYLNLPRCPVLDSKHPAWLDAHVGLSFSDLELAGMIPNPERGVITDLKGTITGLFRLGDPMGRQIFGFRNQKGRFVALIFINDLRLDLPSHTIVADACVIFRFDQKEVAQIVTQADDGSLAYTHIRYDELKLWWQLFPVLAERCREWKHTSACEYLTRGVQTSFDLDQSPLCSCGLGKSLPPSFLDGPRKGLAPLVTRIALSLLFPVSYLEKVGSKFLNSRTRVAERCKTCHGPGKPSLMTCSVCKAAKYCSTACQKDDWKTHKHQCGHSEDARNL